MILGQRIRQLRIEKQLTQIQLGQKINLAESTISLYEANKRAPDYDILLRIATYFKVSVDYLMGLTDVRHVVRYQYAENTPIVTDHDFISINSQSEVCSPGSNPSLMQPDCHFWYQIRSSFPNSHNMLAKDLLLIKNRPVELKEGDFLLIQQTEERPCLCRLVQVGDPTILIPLDSNQKPQILTTQTLQQMPLLGKVLELRRHYGE
jgi:transcriptional regulator with XRE-family HTH domain